MRDSRDALKMLQRIPMSDAGGVSLRSSVGPGPGRLPPLRSFLAFRARFSGFSGFSLEILSPGEQMLCCCSTSFDKSINNPPLNLHHVPSHGIIGILQRFWGFFRDSQPLRADSSGLLLLDNRQSAVNPSTCSFSLDSRDSRDSRDSLEIFSPCEQVPWLCCYSKSFKKSKNNPPTRSLSWDSRDSPEIQGILQRFSARTGTCWGFLWKKMIYFFQRC